MELDTAIFRAYDIRGVVETALRPDVVENIGQALGTLYPQCKKVAVGRDGRLSSKTLADRVIAGLVSAGVEVIDIGEVPTPVLYYATYKLNTGSGVMVTGSHNPPEYNGLKLMMDKATLFGDAIKEIGECVQGGDFSSGLGSNSTYDILPEYIEEIVGDVKLQRSLKIAIDCGNGVAGPTAQTLFSRLGCEVTSLYCDIDGNFPNHHPNPSEPENLEDLIDCVKKNQLDLGLAFDGDGDRGPADEGEGMDPSKCFQAELLGLRTIRAWRWTATVP